VTAGGPKTHHSAPCSDSRSVAAIECAPLRRAPQHDPTSGTSAQRHHHGPSVAGQAVRPTAAAVLTRRSARLVAIAFHARRQRGEQFGLRRLASRGHSACIRTPFPAEAVPRVPQHPPEEMPDEGATTGTAHDVRLHARASPPAADSCAPALDDEQSPGMVPISRLLLRAMATAHAEIAAAAGQLHIGGVLRRVQEIEENSAALNGSHRAVSVLSSTALLGLRSRRPRVRDPDAVSSAHG
jgi:hypothetical protein